MSFRVAYYDLKRKGVSSTNNRGLIRDKSQEEEKKEMDEYYKRMRNWTPSNWRK